MKTTTKSPGIKTKVVGSSFKTLLNLSLSLFVFSNMYAQTYSLGTTGTTSFQSTANASGTVTTCNCPSGSVVVGYGGFNGGFVDRIWLICRVMNSDGSLGATTTVTSANGSGSGGNAVGPYTWASGTASSANAMVGGFLRTGDNLDGMQMYGKKISEIAAGSANNSGFVTQTFFGNSSGGTAQSTLWVPNYYVVIGMNKNQNGSYAGGMSFNYARINSVSCATAPTSISGTTSICNGSSTTLTASGGSGTNFQWGTGGTVGSNIISGQTASSISVSPSSSTTYWVRRTDTSPCSNTVGVTITVSVSTAATAPTSITGTTSICSGSSTTLSASGGSVGSGATYQWGTGSSVGLNIISGQTAVSISVSPGTSTTYWVRRVGSSPCSNTTSGVTTTVSLSTAATAPTSITGTTSICSGSSTTLTASGGSVGSGATYQWGTGSSVGSNIISGQTAVSISVSPGSSTAYWVRRVGSSPCSNTTGGVTTTVSVSTAATAPTSITGTTSICSGSSTTLTASGGSVGSGATYQWGIGSSVGSNIISGQTSISMNVSPTDNSIYWVRRVASPPCSNTTSGVTVTVSILSPVASAAINSGDLIWNGTTSTDWTNVNNWYLYNGSTFTSAVSVPSLTNNVVIPANGTCVLAQPSILNNTTEVNNLTIESGATLTAVGGVLNVHGVWLRYGNFDAGTGTVSFNGTSAQSITGTAALYNLTINNTSGGLTLNSPVSVAGTMTMVQGNISTTNTNILEIGVNESNVGSVNWTNGTVLGPIKRWFTNATNITQASGIFPVGNSVNNRNAQINFTQAPSAAGYIIAEYVAGAPIVNSVALYAGLPAVINGQMIENYENEGYYDITPYSSTNVAYGALNNVSYDLTLRGNQLSTVNDLTKLRIIKSSDHLAWNDNPAGDGDHVLPVGTTSDFTIGAAGMVGFSWFDVGSSDDNALPIELLSLSANCNNSNSVGINWITASEQNTSHFVIEKTRDGINWLTIGETPAAGNSTSLVHYTFVDSENAFEITYYRLTQFDNDGESESFPLVTVNCPNENAESKINIFPNPSRGEFYIDFYSDGHSDEALIKIQNINGMVLYTEKRLSSKGQNIFPVMNLGLSGGIYLVSVQLGEMAPMMSKVRNEKL